MKFILTVYFSLFTLAVAIELPKEVIPLSQLKFEQVTTSTLPRTLQEALLSTDEFEQGTGRLPEHLTVYLVDLNNDKQPEYIIDSNQSYTGGTARVVYELKGKSFNSIAYFQSGFYLGPIYNGYYQICSDGEDRHGEKHPWILQYRDGEYRVAEAQQDAAANP